MYQPDNYEQWQHREEAREQHEQKHQQAELFDEFVNTGEDEEEPEPECQCVRIDVDEMDARYCPAHGPDSEEAHELRAREAEAEFAYWNSPGWAKAFAEWETNPPARKPAASEPGRDEEAA